MLVGVSVGGVLVLSAPAVDLRRGAALGRHAATHTSVEYTNTTQSEGNHSYTVTLCIKWNTAIDVWCCHSSLVDVHST